MNLPPHLVHKHAPDQVLVGYPEAAIHQRWVVPFRLDPRHSYLRRGGFVPLLLWGEVCRQAGMVVCLTDLGVDPDTAFIINRLSVNTTAPTPVGDTGVDSEVIVTVRVESARGGKPDRVRFTFGAREFTGSAEARCLPARNYAALRRNFAGVQAPERHDAPLLPEDATKDGFTALLSWDICDPLVFDHPSDHVPGMQLLAAALEGFALTGAADPHAFDISFEGFIEYDPPAEVTVIRHNDRVETLFTQRGSRLCTAEVW